MADIEPAFTTLTHVPGAIRVLQVDADRPGPAGERVIVFFPGFMLTPWSYRSLFAAIVSDRVSIVAPQLYRRGPGPLAGHPSPGEEAARGHRFLGSVIAARRPEQVWLAGHSRGGQVAWRIAEHVEPDGLVVIDPVDGAGRHPTAPVAVAAPATFGARTLVIGAGLGGRCAPAPVNHERFAAAAPPGSSHTVMDSMGHGDVLDDRPARVARRLCGGSDDPRRERTTVAELVRAFVETG